MSQFQRSCTVNLQGVQKVYLLDYFAVFAAIAWNFKAKLYRHILSSHYAHNTGFLSNQHYNAVS